MCTFNEEYRGDKSLSWNKWSSIVTFYAMQTLCFDSLQSLYSLSNMISFEITKRNLYANESWNGTRRTTKKLRRYFVTTLLASLHILFVQSCAPETLLQRTMRTYRKSKMKQRVESIRRGNAQSLLYPVNAYTYVQNKGTSWFDTRHARRARNRFAEHFFARKIFTADSSATGSIANVWSSRGEVKNSSRGSITVTYINGGKHFVLSSDRVIVATVHRPLRLSRITEEFFLHNWNIFQLLINWIIRS